MVKELKELRGAFTLSLKFTESSNRYKILCCFRKNIHAVQRTSWVMLINDIN